MPGLPLVAWKRTRFPSAQHGLTIPSRGFVAEAHGLVTAVVDSKTQWWIHTSSRAMASAWAASTASRCLSASLRFLRRVLISST
eukprot:1195424-Prorocentrum_minimum.AAC.17